MKFAKALLIISFILWGWLIADAWGEDICFDSQTASRLVVEIEQCRNIAEQNILLEQALASANNQISIGKEKQEQDNKACDAMIKAVKPTIFSRMRDFLIDAGIVGIAGIVLWVAL